MAYFRKYREFCEIVHNMCTNDDWLKTLDFWWSVELRTYRILERVQLDCLKQLEVHGPIRLTELMMHYKSTKMNSLNWLDTQRLQEFLYQS